MKQNINCELLDKAECLSNNSQFMFCFMKTFYLLFTSKHRFKLHLFIIRDVSDTVAVRPQKWCALAD